MSLGSFVFRALGIDDPKVRARQLEATLSRLDVLLEDVRRVEVERAGSRYEVTVHYWHVAEDRETHAHFGGDTLPQAIERAHAFVLTLPRAWTNGEDLPLPDATPMPGGAP